MSVRNPSKKCQADLRQVAGHLYQVLRYIERQMPNSNLVGVSCDLLIYQYKGCADPMHYSLYPWHWHCCHSYQPPINTDQDLILRRPRQTTSSSVLPSDTMFYILLWCNNISLLCIQLYIIYLGYT